MFDFGNNNTPIKDYSVLGGLLYLPAVSLFFTMLLGIIGFLKEIIPALSLWEVFTTPGSEYFHENWDSLLIFKAVTNGVVVLLSIVTLILFMQRRKIVPMLMIGFYTGSILFTAGDFLIGQSIPVIAESQEALRAGVENLVRVIMVGGIFIPYFLRSERVRGYFVE